MADLGKQSVWDEEAEAEAASASPPIADELKRLFESARRMAAAELAYQSTRARLMARAAAWIAAGGALVAALLFFVLMALVLGLLLALAPLLGPWGAMGAVVGGLLLATLVAAWVTLHGVRKFRALLRDGKEKA